MKKNQAHIQAGLKKLMVRALSGDLDPDGLNRLEKDLAGYPGLRGLWTRLQSLHHRPAETDFYPPGDFAAGVMQRIETLPIPARKTLKSPARLFSLPATPREMAFTFMSMGLFFLIVCLIFIMRLDPGLVAGGSGFLFYLCLAPSLAGAGVLLRLGWKAVREPGTLRDSKKGIVFPAVLFSLTVVGGSLLPGSWELVMISAWLGLSGLAATGFLAFAWRQYFKEVYT